MTLIFAIVWLICGSPGLAFTPELNGWAAALALCVAFDLVGMRSER